MALTGGRIVVGENRLVSSPSLVDANNSPTMARHPLRPEKVIVVHRVDRPDYSARLEWSNDGGASWTPTALPLPVGKARPFTPHAAFAPDGTLSVVYVNLEGAGNVPANLWFATSRDGGRSLDGPIRVAGPLTFQPRIAVSPRGIIHITWLQGAEVGTLSLPGGPNAVVAVASRDGGRTFSSPVAVSDPHRARVAAASPVVDSTGALAVVYQDYKDDRRDFENLDGPPWDRPFSLVVARSPDGGRSFSPGNELESGVVAARRFLVFLPESPSVAAGPGGVLYVAWTDGRNGDEDVFLRRSGNGGTTWDEPVRVNDNAVGDGTSQYLPRVAVAPDGRVDVVYFDRRRDARNVMNDVFIASSHDGRRFGNIRISSRSFDSQIGPVTAPHLGVDLGNSLALVSGNRTTIAAWTDTRLGNADSGRQDIAFSAVAVGRRPPPWARPPATALLFGTSLAAVLHWRSSRVRAGKGSTPALASLRGT